MKLLSLIVVSCALLTHATPRALKVVGYQFIPDLNHDNLATLSAKLEADFFADTGYTVDITYDFSFLLSTYNVAHVVHALLGQSLWKNNAYDVFEIDTVVLGHILNKGAIRTLPSSVVTSGHSTAALQMCAGYCMPTYSCSNMHYSYDSSLSGVKNIAQLTSFIDARIGLGGLQVGWASDLSNALLLRCMYIDSYLDSWPTHPLFPDAYSATLNNTVVGYIQELRDRCTNVVTGVNDCMSGQYYGNPDFWFTEFLQGKSLVLNGFPEYFSSIIELDPANTDVTHPTRYPGTFSGITGNGNQPYLFTDAFAMSANCQNVVESDGFNCETVAVAWMNWSKTHYVQTSSLGKDLSPVRPRFLAASYLPFWNSSDVTSLPAYATDHYAAVHSDNGRATPLETMDFWTNSDTQANALYESI